MEIKPNGMLGRYMKIACLVLGFVFVTFGVVFFTKFDKIYNYIIRTAMDFNPESEPFKVWRMNDPPLILDFYFFNWTNSQDIYNHSVKPRFEQIGPYRFFEVKEKVNITWHENSTISYKYVKRYQYYDDGISRNLSDTLTTINPVMLTAAYRQRHNIPFLLNLALASQPMFITRTINEFLFEGYKDSLLSLFSFIQKNVPDRFGFFYKRNNSVSLHEVEMYTGQDEFFGSLLSSNYQNHSGIYEGECGDIRGSAGEFFPIDLKPTFIEVYSPELCKYAHLEYERNVTIKGINAYKFGSRSLFDNGTLNPSNKCFCTGECIPTGVQNVSSCRGDSPTFLSLPHFYNADPYYLSLLEGLHPNKDKHELQISLEPKSSVIVDTALRMQINMLMQPLEGITKFRNVPTVYVPMFFFDQTVTLSDHVLAKIKLLQDLPASSNLICFGTILSGSILLGITIFLFIFVREGKTVDPKKNPIAAFEVIPLRFEKDAKESQ